MTVATARDARLDGLRSQVDGGLYSEAEMSDKQADRPTHTQEELAGVLLRRATLARSVEAFGEAIVRASLVEAAQMIKEGKGLNGTVEFPAKVWIRFVPDPNNIDVQFEECMSIGRQTALQCYIESHAPRLPALKPR